MDGFLWNENNAKIGSNALLISANSYSINSNSGQRLPQVRMHRAGLQVAVRRQAKRRQRLGIPLLGRLKIDKARGCQRTGGNLQRGLEQRAFERRVEKNQGLACAAAQLPCPLSVSSA